jgi:hypothetical protein
VHAPAFSCSLRLSCVQRVGTKDPKFVDVTHVNGASCVPESGSSWQGRVATSTDTDELIGYRRSSD